MKKLFITFIAIAMSVFAMSAQESNRDSNGNLMFGPYETNSFFSNWFVEVNGGVNVPFDNLLKTFNGGIDYDFGGLAVDVNLGKWIDPVYGFRLGWHGLTTGNLVNNVEFSNSFNRENIVNYVHGDFVVNFSNLVAGYKDERTFNFVPYVTAGALFNENGRSLGVGGGLQVPIRFSSVVSLVPQIQGVATNGAIYGGDGVTVLSSATVGLKFNLGKRTWARKSTTVNSLNSRYNTLETNYNELESLLQIEVNKNKSLTDENAKLVDEIETLKKLVEESSAKKSTMMDFNIGAFVGYFEIGKTVLSNKELRHLDYFVNNVAKNIEGSVTFYVNGSSDSKTGSKNRNAYLRNARAEYIYDLLVNRYGLTDIQKNTQTLEDIDSSNELSRAFVISFE